ncbi:hypothetical protein PF010_g24109 [Phytophthora fragariae]|nr:hypothetical protein PF010_g24109 [Phytophthora fragariae]KAE9173772.1 hypothetical protein PF004_g26861 [Phytophthora fragariae]
MRLHFVLLWLAVVTFALRAEASATIQSAPDAADLLLFGADKDGEFTKRALRTDGAKNEEKGGFPGISKFTGLFSKTRGSPLKLEPMDPRKFFNELRLGEAGLKLDDNPAVLEWLKYVDMHWAKHKSNKFIDGDVYLMLLQSSRSEVDVAKLFQSLKRGPGIAKLGEDLQQTQFRSWIIKEMHPDSIPGLLRLRNGIPTNDPRTEIVDKYAMAFFWRMSARDKNKESTIAKLDAVLKANRNSVG